MRKVFAFVSQIRREQKIKDYRQDARLHFGPDVNLR